MHTPANRHFVAAQGTVEQIETAFATTLNNYRVSGMNVRAPSTDLSVPTAIAKLSAARSASTRATTSSTRTRSSTKAPPTGFRNAAALQFLGREGLPIRVSGRLLDLSNPATAPWSVKGNTPDQIKGAYGISGHDGAGQTVAIIDAYASPTISRTPTSGRPTAACRR
jgi:subtilase family serine protease